MKTDYHQLGQECMERLRSTCEKGWEVQEAQLYNLLYKNKDTWFGKKYGFSRIKSVNAYQKTVPLSCYADYESAIAQIMQGKKNILTGEEPVYYSISSGSTGEPKYVPVTVEDMMVHYRYAYGAVFGMAEEYYRDRKPEEIFGKIFQTGEFFRTFHENGVMNGIRSSSLYQWMDREEDFDTSDYTAPKEVLFPEQIENLDYIKIRFALACRDIRCIHGVFIHKLVSLFRYIMRHWDLLLRDMETGTVDDSIPLTDEWREKIRRWLPPDPDRASELRRWKLDDLKDGMVAKLWGQVNYILVIGGSAFSIYMKELTKYAKGIPVHYFAYASSEGIFGLASGMNCQDSYILLPEAGFFEFFPEEGRGEEPLTIKEVLEGRRYELIFTNHSGLYRYQVGDIIEVTGFFGQAPVIRFCYRKNQVINLADEKLNTAQLTQAIQKLEECIQDTVSGYCIQEDFSVNPARYLIYIEGISREGNELDQVMDLCLRKTSFGYDSCRNMGEISMAHVELLSEGSFEKYEKYLSDHGRFVGQSKPLHILDNGDHKSFFEKEIRRGLQNE